MGELRSVCLSQRSLLEQCCAEMNAGREETVALVEVVEQLSKQVEVLAADHQQPAPRSRVRVERALPEPCAPQPSQSEEPRQSFLLVSKPQITAQLQAVEESMLQLKSAVADNAKLVPAVKLHKNYLQKSLQRRTAWQLA